MGVQPRHRFHLKDSALKMIEVIVQHTKILQKIPLIVSLLAVAKEIANANVLSVPATRSFLRLLRVFVERPRYGFLFDEQRLRNTVSRSKE